jgi:hypothetical protein
MRAREAAKPNKNIKPVFVWANFFSEALFLALTNH